MIPLLQVKDLCFAYPNGHDVFKNLSFEIFPREKVCIVGKNGAGKTTLFYIIMGLLHPVKGEIILDGKVIRTKDDLRYLRKPDFISQPHFLTHLSFKNPMVMGFSSTADRISRKNVGTTYCAFLALYCLQYW